LRTAWLVIAATLACAPALGQDDPATDPGGGAEEELPAETKTYALSVSKSWIYVVIYNDNDRWTPITGHDHGIRATSFTGIVTWNADDASVCSVDIRVPYSGLRIDPPGMRERLKFSADGAISDDQKKKVVGNMLTKGQLDQGSFSEARFQSISCSGTEGKVDVTGNLSVRGVAKKITIQMDVGLDGDTFTAAGGITLGHADFGMKPFTYGPGTPKNQEKLTFGLDVVGTAN